MSNIPVSVTLTIDGATVIAPGTVDIPDPVPPPSAADVAAALLAQPGFEQSVAALVTPAPAASAASVAAALAATPSFVAATTGKPGTSPSAASVEAILAADQNFIKAVAAAVSGTVSLPPVNPNPPPPPAAPFDYYIRADGDDNNPGTLASPWSITALNSKMSLYAGKRVGIIGDIGGVQTPIQQGSVGGVKTTLYSMLMGINAGQQNAAIKINGGTAATPTYIGSCTSAGVYKALAAIIDASNPVAGVLPTGANAIIMGQPFYMTTAVPNPGYTTLDGLIVRNFNYAGIIFGDVQTNQLQGVVIQNCKVYNGVCSTSAENPGGIFLGNTSGAKVLNTQILNCTTSGGTFSPWGMGGITTYKAAGLIVTGCTITGCGYSIQNKDGNQYGTYSYNYLDCGNFGSATNLEAAAPIKSCIPGKGQTLSVHHNILIGGYWGWGEDGTNIDGAIIFENNTLYTPPGVTGMALAAWFKSNSDASITWQNNIVAFSKYYNNQGGPFGCLSCQGGFGISAASVNFNYYGTGMTFGTSAAVANLAAWQALGFDKNSLSGGSPFVATPVALVPSSFQISGAALTAGAGGKPMGALDGSGTVGCNL